MFFIALLLNLICLIWLLVRIWKSSPVLAIVTFLFFPAAIVSLIQNWGDEETDIRWPFFLSLILYAWLVYAAMKMIGDEELDAALSFATSMLA